MSYQIRIDPMKRAAGRLILAVRRALQDEAERSGMSQADIARGLGVDRAVVHRQLSGEANLTLRTLAEYGELFGRTVQIRFLDPHAGATGANHHNVVVAAPEGIKAHLVPSAPLDAPFVAWGGGHNAGVITRSASAGPSVISVDPAPETRHEAPVRS